MQVANASTKQGLEKVIHRATDSSYGSDNTRVAGEDETREEERIINHFQMQPFCVGTRCVWVKGHSIANTISGLQPVFPKGLCAPFTKKGLRIEVGLTSPSVTPSTLVSSSDSVHARGRAMCEFYEACGQVRQRCQSKWRLLRLACRDQPSASGAPHSTKGKGHARAMCDFCEVCGSAARALSHLTRG